MIEAVVMGDLQRYRWGAQKKNISELVLKDKSTDKRLFLVLTMLLNTHLLPFLNMPCSFFQCMYWALVTSSLNATSSVVAIVVGILESEAGTRWWEVVWSARMIYSAGHLNTLCPPTHIVSPPITSFRNSQWNDPHIMHFSSFSTRGADWQAQCSRGSSKWRQWMTNLLSTVGEI